jgi:NhaA family Na+:H+ antiporter
VLALQRLGVRRSLAYVVPGMVLWWGMYRSGVHAAIAGVVIGLLTPVRPWLGAEGFVDETRRVLGVGDGGAADEELMGMLERVRHAQREALPPVVRIQAALNPWVAYGIMPLFALANAGVDLRGAALGGDAPSTVVIGVLLGLWIGKPVGVSLACWATVRLGWCALPRGIGWRGILLVGCVAGIGFTMAIFTAGLAFPNPDWLAAAKLGVLGGSMLAAVIGLTLGRTVLLDAPDPAAARTVDEAEASTEL